MSLRLPLVLASLALSCYAQSSEHRHTPLSRVVGGIVLGIIALIASLLILSALFRRRRMRTPRPLTWHHPRAKPPTTHGAPLYASQSPYPPPPSPGYTPGAYYPPPPQSPSFYNPEYPPRHAPPPPPPYAHDGRKGPRGDAYASPPGFPGADGVYGAGYYQQGLYAPPPGPPPPAHTTGQDDAYPGMYR